MRARFFLLATLAACSVSEKHPSGNGGIDAGDDGGMSIDADERHVTGTSMLTHYTRAGDSVATTTAPEDLSIYSFAAYVPDTGEATGFRIINGTGSTTGTLMIPDVPMGPYYLRVLLSGTSAPTFYYTDDRSLDLGFGTAGKPGVPDVTLPSTVNPTITGLDRTWDQDFFSLHSLGTGTEHYPITLTSPPIGAVPSLTSAFDWTTGYGWALPRMRPKLLQNDDVEILHHRVAQQFLTGQTITTQYLLELARMSGLTQTDGQALAVSGAFTNVTLDQSVDINIDLSSLRQAYGNAPHVQEITNTGINVFLGTDPHNRFGPGLVYFDHFNIPSTTSTIVKTVPYGIPYDNTWALSTDASYGRRRRVRLPGTTTPGNVISTSVFSTRPYTSGPIGATVQVGPPTNLRVGGNAATDGVRTLGTAPVTNAARYSVSVRRIVAGTSATGVATFITTETSVNMPAELFAAGERYVFVISAFRDGLAYANGRLRAAVIPSYVTSSATGVILLSNTCGNGVREGAEECDTSGQSATCDVDCSLPQCFDGILNTAASEECDPGVATGSCDVGCTLAVCGDGTLNRNRGEECDDMNLDNLDGCDSQCHWEDSCPDGSTQPLYGEECDDNNEVDTDNCVDCRFAFCGDGFLNADDPNEQCDDGNNHNGDGCSDACVTEP
jgi:cysteine-rich repeat protein